MKLFPFLFLLTPTLCLAQFTSVNCSGDGSTDVTSCINTILAANDTVFFPTPTVCYKITGALQLHSGQTIMGAKRPASGNGGICSYSTTADALFASYGTSGTRNIVIENLYINDAVMSTRTSGAAIHIDGATDAAVFNIHDNQTYGFQDSLWIASTINSRVANNRFTLAKNDGVHQSGASTSVGFYNNYVDAPTRYCYYVSSMNYSTFDSNACDNSGGDGYHFEATSSGTGPIRGIVLNGNGAEHPSGNGMYLDGQSFTVNSPTLTTIGTGKAGILVIGGNIQIANGFIIGGAYGISLPNPPAHGAPSTSVVVTNTYFESQSTSQYYDPNALIQKPF